MLANPSILQFRLIQEVFNHQVPVSLSHRLYTHLHLSNILPSELRQNFGRLNITSSVHGLYSTNFPLWKLGYFLGEEWLQDSILDGLAEIQYFKTGVALVPIGASPTFLFLPTGFMHEARRLYHNQAITGYSRELRALRERIRHTVVMQIGFLDHSTNHYSSYSMESFHLLKHGDSMHREPANDVLPILHWVLSGLSTNLPLSIEMGIMDRQGRGGGEGSCGIAAHNFVACEIDPALPRWTAQSSRDVRDHLLRELCLYNHIASETVGVCFSDIERGRVDLCVSLVVL